MRRSSGWTRSPRRGSGLRGCCLRVGRVGLRQQRFEVGVEVLGAIESEVVEDAERAEVLDATKPPVRGRTLAPERQIDPGLMEEDHADRARPSATCCA